MYIYMYVIFIIERRGEIVHDVLAYCTEKSVGKNENYNSKMLARHEYCIVQVEKERPLRGLEDKFCHVNHSGS